jgi:hypothetical protein
MEARAAREGARRFGEKTPWNVRHLAALEALFPCARFVHIVRDPRAVVASKRKLPRTSADVLTNAFKWSIDITAAASYRASAPERAERLLEVRYEDLVRDPEKVLREITAFLGEPFHPAMLDPAEAGPLAFKDQPYREGVLRPVFDCSLEAWRKELSPAQVWLVQRLTAGGMARYGYVPEPVEAREIARLPVQILREIRAWLRFKREEARLSAAEPQIRFRARAASLYQLLLHGLLKHLSSGGFF